MLEIYLTKVKSDFLTFSITSSSPSSVFAELKQAYFDSVKVLSSYRHVDSACFALHEGVAIATKQRLENVNPLTPPLLQAGMKMLTLFFLDHSRGLTTLDVLLSRLSVADETSRSRSPSLSLNESLPEHGLALTLFSSVLHFPFWSSRDGRRFRRDQRTSR